MSSEVFFHVSGHTWDNAQRNGVASIAALAIIVPRSRARRVVARAVLREQGLVRSGVAYIFKEEEDLRDRIAEIGRQLASWKEEQAGLDRTARNTQPARLQHKRL